MGAFMMSFLGVTIREDYDFVNAKDGESASYVAAEGGSQFMRLCTGVRLAQPA